jgi:hypothetical protein
MLYGRGLRVRRTANPPSIRLSQDAPPTATTRLVKPDADQSGA